jgi:hypothetical protein
VSRYARLLIGPAVVRLVTISALPRVLAALTAIGLQVAACQSTAPPPPIAAVTIVPESIEVVVRGAVQLTAAMWDASGRSARGRVVTWASSDPSVATVSATGLVTARLKGSTTVTVTCEDQRATAVIIVFVPMGV